MRTVFIAIAIIALAAGGLLAPRLSGLDSDTSPFALRSARPPSVDLARAQIWYARRAEIPAYCYAALRSDETAHVDAIQSTTGPEKGVDQAACSVCHEGPDSGPRAPEKVSGAIAFHEVNLLVDRRRADRSDLEAYIDEDNYSALPTALLARGWSGFIPDLDDLALGLSAFDRRGMARDDSGWAAYRFAPHPTRWPAALGAYADSAIRLPLAFQINRNGRWSVDAYLANLAILELAITDRATIDTAPIDEALLEEDLDGDGAFSVAFKVNRRDRFIGGANDIPARSDSFPVGTEFLQTLRYLDASGARVTSARRMKEVRYLRKASSLNPSFWARARSTRRDGRDGPHAPTPLVAVERGVETGSGWVAQAFIEDASGALRPQTREELQSCVGCHGGLGASVDSVFSFARKLKGEIGWGHQEVTAFDVGPQSDELRREIEQWLRWTDGDALGRRNAQLVDGALGKRALSEIMLPTPGQAVQFNAASREIAEEQSYLFGRTPTLAPANGLLETVDPRAIDADDADIAWSLRLND